MSSQKDMLTSPPGTLPNSHAAASPHYTKLLLPPTCPHAPPQLLCGRALVTDRCQLLREALSVHRLGRAPQTCSQHTAVSLLPLTAIWSYTFTWDFTSVLTLTHQGTVAISALFSLLYLQGWAQTKHRTLFYCTNK